MSNENTSDTAERTFKTVNGKVLGGAEGIRFIRPKSLAEAGTTGVVVQGVYEGTTPNSYDESKPDYKIREEDGTLAILNSTGSLASQLRKVEAGSFIRVTYLGMQPMTKGKMAGKLSHSFIVEVAE